MTKRMIALVLALFLVIGLLPVVRAVETGESNQNRTGKRSRRRAHPAAPYPSAGRRISSVR